MARVFHINKGIGMSSSGIEYAQKYRYDLVKDFPEEQIFVYCDYIYSNYTRFTDNIGIEMEMTLNAYHFMAGQQNHRSTYTVEEFADKLTDDFSREVAADKRSVSYKKAALHYKVWLIEADGAVDRVDTIVNNRLQEVAHYSDRLTSIDYYSGREIFCRIFFDESGKESMKQFLHENKIVLTLVDDLVLQGSSAFYSEFFRRLQFSSSDIVIMDRNQDLGKEILENKNDATAVVVVHAEHFSTALTDDDWTLWNNYYEYVFVNHKHIDAFITSTDKQTERLRAQFAQAGHPESKILTIPVGTVPAISDGKNVEKNKYKFLTASRLAAEKHIDILVKAVAEAKKELSELEFHIYGAGGLEKSLREEIEKLSAQDYIVMEGHKHLTDEYEKYGGYLTASGSEGFGLTILEAVSACLPMIGLDVDYGNTTFIKDGVNGCLLPRGTEDEQVEAFAAAIVKMVTTLNYSEAISYAQEIAQPYLSSNVRAMWRDFYDDCLRLKGVK